MFSRSSVPPALTVLLAIGLRAWAAHQDPVIFGDGPRFVRSAQLFLVGDFRQAFADAFHPLTSIGMAGVSWASGLGLESAGIFLSIVSGGLATWAIYRLAGEMFGERIALLGALLFAVFPRMVGAASNVQSDGIHLALCLGGALYAWRALEHGRFRDGLGAGLLCALAYLTRPEGLAVGVVLGVWLLYDRVRGRIAWAGFLRVTAGFAGTILLLAGPYLGSLQGADYWIVLSQKKHVFSPELWDLSLAGIGSACWEVMRDFQRGWEALWVFVVLAFRWRRPSRQTLFLGSYTVLFLIVLLLVHLEAGYISRRHWLVPGALLLPIAATGILRVIDTLAEWLRVRQAPRRTVLIAAGLLIGGFALHDVLDRPAPVKLARREAALWLRDRPVRVIAGNRPRAAYYANAERFVSFPVHDDARTLARDLREKGVEYVVVEATSLPAADSQIPVGLELLHRVPYSQGEVFVLRVE